MFFGKRGEGKPTGDTLEVVCDEPTTLSWVVLLLSKVVNGLQERTSLEMMDGFNIRHVSQKFGRYDIQHNDTRNIDFQHNYNLSMTTLSLTMRRITMLSIAALSMTVLTTY